MAAGVSTQDERSPERRLTELGLSLPAAARPAVGVTLSYRRLVQAGNVAYLAGHLPASGDEFPYLGRVGAEVSAEQGFAAARLTALSMFRTIRDELGSLDRVSRWLRVNGYVRSAEGFYQQPFVMNGFTDLVRDLWGEEALPSRSAIGVSELPLGVCVEVDAVVLLA